MPVLMGFDYPFTEIADSANTGMIMIPGLPTSRAYCLQYPYHPYRKPGHDGESELNL
jgi:hypothetical protein